MCTPTTVSTIVYTVMYGDFDVMGVFFDEKAAYASASTWVQKDDVYDGDVLDVSDVPDVPDVPEATGQSDVDIMSYTRSSPPRSRTTGPTLWRL
jgi:hypothetical protein